MLLLLPSSFLSFCVSFLFFPCVLSIPSAWIVLETIWGREGNISQGVGVVVVVCWIVLETTGAEAERQISSTSSCCIA